MAVRSRSRVRVLIPELIGNDGRSPASASVGADAGSARALRQKLALVLLIGCTKTPASPVKWRIGRFLISTRTRGMGKDSVGQGTPLTLEHVGQIENLG